MHEPGVKFMLFSILWSPATWITSEKLKAKPKRKKKPKTKTLVVHEEQKLRPFNLPSGSTRSDDDKLCGDSFTSLKKTCRKLGISFLDYLTDRINRRRKIPPLWEILTLKMSEKNT